MRVKLNATGLRLRAVCVKGVLQGEAERVATEPVFEGILFQREQIGELPVLPASIVSLPAR